MTVPGAKGEEWRNRPATTATLRVYDFAFFRKVGGAEGGRVLEKGREGGERLGLRREEEVQAVGLPSSLRKGKQGGGEGDVFPPIPSSSSSILLPVLQIVMKHDTGLGEAYMEGMFDTKVREIYEF